MRWLHAPQLTQGGLHGHARRHAVVDDDDGAPGRCNPGPHHRPLAPVALDDGDLPRRSGGDVVLVQRQFLDDLGVEHDLGIGAVGNGADRQLRLIRGTDLAHEDDVEWCAQRPGDLRADGNAAARQGEHQRRFQPSRPEFPG